MIEYEISNVKQQQHILVKKLNLIESIEEQYKEQVKLLNQQVCNELDMVHWQLTSPKIRPSIS